MLPTQDNSFGRSRTGFHRRMADTEMDITPMIDITFLLLIFFLVASRIDDNTLQELPTARNGESISVDNSVVLSVMPAGQNITVHGGEKIATETQLGGLDAASQSNAILEFIEAEMNGKIPKRQVLIRADKRLKHRDVARVISAAGQVSDVKVFIAVMEGA